MLSLLLLEKYRKKQHCRKYFVRYYQQITMGKSFGFRFLAVATVLTVAIIQVALRKFYSYFDTTMFINGLIAISISQVDGAEMGTIACTNGKWVPDAKLIAFGLTCPLPLDGTTKSKGKTVSCAFKKLGIFDGTTVEKDKIPGAVCPVFSNADLQKQCKQQVQSCLKDGELNRLAPNSTV